MVELADTTDSKSVAARRAGSTPAWGTERKKMKISFIPSSKDIETVVPAPKPAKEYLPRWYLEKDRFYGGRPKISDGHVSNNTIKACLPFYDSMTHGYIQESWCDIFIEFSDDGSNVKYDFSSFPTIMSLRDSVSIDISDDFYKFEFVWHSPWMPKVPNGWSVMFKSPSNRMDLPFVSLDGIVDSDNFYLSDPGSYPFFIKKSKKNIFIPKGTPMYQMIPIKRESWESEYSKFDHEENLKMIHKSSSVFFSSYKKFFHVKKNFS